MEVNDIQNAKTLLVPPPPRPIATLAQAIDCFLRVRMDVLFIGPFILYKTENQHLSENRASFAEAQA